jgi:hypothetical protein
MQFTRITISHVLWFATVPAFALGLASGALEHSGWILAVLIGVIGFVSGHFAWCLLIELLRRANMMRIAGMSTKKLWASVRRPNWNFNKTLALLQLAAREEEVTCELPRIVRMLQSDSMLERIYGWDALRLVFTPLAEELKEYDPRESTENCRDKVSPLRDRITSEAG